MPIDLIPRIWTYGYSANLVSDTSRGRVRYFASDLLRCLENTVTVSRVGQPPFDLDPYPVQ